MEAAVSRRAAMAVITVATASLCRLAVAEAAAKMVPFVKKTVASNDVVIFSKSYCPYSKRAKAVFAELKKEPHVVELDQRKDGSDIQDALAEVIGKRTVPQVFVHGNYLGGSDDTIEAYESGKLLTLLGIKTDS